MNPPKSVSILGCGWLGLPLAWQLKSLGYVVKGSTTSPEKLALLAEAGIAPYLIQLSEGQLPEDFLDTDVLLIAVPPGRTAERYEDYRKFFEKFSQHPLPEKLQQIVFVSSTSVYAEENGEVSESHFPQSEEPNGKLLAEVENMLFQLPVRVCCLRCGGLIGPNRHPGRFFAGKTAISNGMAPVNMIHLDDVVAIIELIISKGFFGPMNAVAPSHPSRAEFYTRAAVAAGYEIPSFKEELLNWKQIKPARLLHINYPFKHPNLMDLLSKNAF